MPSQHCSYTHTIKKKKTTAGGERGGPECGKTRHKEKEKKLGKRRTVLARTQKSVDVFEQVRKQENKRASTDTNNNRGN